MNPELNFLLQAIRPPKGGNQERPAIPPDLDWNRLRRLAVTYEVFPLVNRYIKTSDSQQQPLPPTHREEWRKQAQIYAMQSLTVARQLLSIIDLLGQRDIGIIPFKGPVLARQAYSDVALRQFTDLDFFVNPRDYLEVYNILTDVGFTLADKTMEPMVGYWAKLGRDLVLRNSRIVLDIHPRLIQGPSMFAISPEMWKRTTTIQLLDRPVNALSTEDTLIALALHGARNNWTSLKALTDTAHLLANNPNMDRPYILRTMKQFGVGKILETALKMARQLFDVPIPIEISRKPVTGALFNALAPDNKEDDDHALILAVMFRSLDSFRQKTRYLRYFLFTPTTEDVRRVRLPKSMRFFYRILRPCRLAWRFLMKILPSPPHVQKKRMS
jgi:hypothetical protein